MEKMEYIHYFHEEKCFLRIRLNNITYIIRNHKENPILRFSHNVIIMARTILLAAKQLKKGTIKT